MNIQTITHNDFVFVDVHDPKELEIKTLRQEYGFDQLHLEDFINQEQIPKVESTKDYTLFVLDFPYVEVGEDSEKKPTQNGHTNEKKNPTLTDFVIKPVTALPALPFNQAKKKKIRTGHVNFFVGKNYLVVLHDENTPVIDDFFAECQKTLQKREQVMHRGSFYLFYTIVDLLVSASFTTVKELAAVIDKIDVRLLQDNPPQTIVEDIAVARRNIVVFRSMMKPAVNIFNELVNGEVEGVSPPLTTSWRNIRDRLKKITYRLDGTQDLIEGISKSHESLLTARTNEIVKALTIFTAVMLPLTLIASIYGMNIVGLPYAEDREVLKMLGMLMVGIAGLMMIGFKLIKWL